MPTSADVAADVAARLVTRLVDIQVVRPDPVGGAHRRRPSASTCCRRINSSPSRGSVDWRRVEIYWGDERFVPADSRRPEREAGQGGPAGRGRRWTRRWCTRWPPSDGEFGADLDAAAAAYGRLVDRRDEPFDVTLLGLGPDGHVASIFPEHPAVYDDRTVVAVRNSPKPPPTRISLSLPTIRTSHEVWVVTAGAGKAGAVAMAFGAAGEMAVPAVGAVGTVRTLVADRPGRRL